MQTKKKSKTKTKKKQGEKNVKTLSIWKREVWKHPRQGKEKEEEKEQE